MGSGAASTTAERGEYGACHYTLAGGVRVPRNLLSSLSWLSLLPSSFPPSSHYLSLSFFRPLPLSPSLSASCLFLPIPLCPSAVVVYAPRSWSSSQTRSPLRTSFFVLPRSFPRSSGRGRCYSVSCRKRARSATNLPALRFLLALHHLNETQRGDRVTAPVSFR